MIKIMTNYTKKIIFNEADFFKNSASKMSNDAKDLIKKLLDKNQKTRIQLDKIKEHKFFDLFDFKSVLERKIKPEFIPDLKGPDDLKYIDPSLTTMQADDSIQNGFSPILEKVFVDFTYSENTFDG